MRTRVGCRDLSATGRPWSKNGMEALINVPALSSNGGTYSYRRPRSSVMLSRILQVSVK